MPRKIRPKPCGCGCKGMTRGGEFLPGHDAKLVGAIIEHVGGTANLKTLVEEFTKTKVKVVL